MAYEQRFGLHAAKCRVRLLNVMKVGHNTMSHLINHPVLRLGVGDQKSLYTDG